MHLRIYLIKPFNVVILKWTDKFVKSRLSLIVQVNVVLNRTVVVVTVNNNSPIQDYIHPDEQTQPTFEMTPGFKPSTNLLNL